MIDDAMFCWELARGIYSMVGFCKDAARHVLPWIGSALGVFVMWWLCSGDSKAE